MESLSQSNYSFVASFSNDLDKFEKLKPQKEKKKRKKTNVYNKASKLYNDWLHILINTIIYQM